MISGPGYRIWLKPYGNRWLVIEEGGGWGMTYGPYRWKWLAKLMSWVVGI